jgi:hypothetical protein
MAITKEDTGGNVSSQEQSKEKEAKPSGFKCYMVGQLLKRYCTIAYTDSYHSVSSRTLITPVGSSMLFRSWLPLQQALLCRSWTSFSANS